MAEAKFEDALKNLEKIVEDLEGGELSLDKSLARYEEGIKLVKFCQKKLDLAGMKKWAVRLIELPKRGMVVMVGLEQYNGIDEVPYEQVRTVIRESVSEWEQHTDMGSFVQ